MSGDSSMLLSADAFFAKVKKEDPARYAEALKKYPERRTLGPSRRAGWRNREEGSRLPIRSFTDSEWEEAKEAKRKGTQEWYLDYIAALQQTLT